MIKIAAVLLLLIGPSVCMSQETPPPFAASDFCKIVRDPVHPDSLKIQYEPGPRTWNRGRIFEREVSPGEPSRIQVDPPADDPAVTKPSNTRDGRMTACFSTTIDPRVGALAWKQNGETLDKDQLLQLAEKPIRGVLLRDKPSDWNSLAEYAAYLDEDVVFIYPGPLLSAVERSER